MPRFDGRWFPSSNTSDWAAGKFGTPGWYPAAPTGVTPTEGDQQVALSWDAGNTHGSDITGYKVEKNDGSSWSTATSDTGSDATSYTATGLTNGTGYTFRVTAINSVGLGETVSSASAASTPRGVPGAPGTLSLAEGDPAHTVIDLSWSAGSTNGSAITGYKIQRSTDGSSWSTLVADTGSTGTTYSSTGLTAETTYHYRVAAINVAGVGGYGNEPSRDSGDAVMLYTTTGSPTVTTHGIYTSLEFTGTGTLVVTANPHNLTMNIYTLGGGGSGGYNRYGGGGGGGGSVTTTSQVMTVGTWNMTIGGSATSTTTVGPSSSPSITGSAGGAGGMWAGSAGGCGGGAGGAGNGTNSGGVGSLGENGGTGSGVYSYPNQRWQRGGGGGGGMVTGGYNGSDGGAWGSPSGGAGGPGEYNDYKTGSNIGYAGGGGGGAEAESYNMGNSGNVATGGGAASGGAGATNRGGGGSSKGAGSTGGAGGSGVVVVRWVTPT